MPMLAALVLLPMLAALALPAVALGGVFARLTAREPDRERASATGSSYHFAGVVGGYASAVDVSSSWCGGEERRVVRS
jgi:hypothetical protein